MSEDNVNTEELNMEELMREENDRIDSLILPECWTSTSQDLYVYWDDEKKEDVLNSEKEHKRLLKIKGLRGTKLPTEIISPVEKHLANSRNKFSVEYVGRIGCLPHGFQERNGRRYYNTGGWKIENPSGFVPQLVKPIEEAFAMLLGGREHPQYSLVRGILKQHYTSLQVDWLDDWVPPVTVLVGSSLSQIKIFSSLFHWALGGEKMINPIPYLDHPSSSASASLAESLCWRVKSLPKNSISLLFKLFSIEELRFGKANEVSLPFLPQRIVFVENTAEALKGLSPSSLRSANVIYLHSTGDYRFHYGTADFLYFAEQVMFDPEVRPVLQGGYRALEVSKTLFDASLAGEAYQVLCRNIPQNSSPVSETELLTHLENSSRHFQNRMNRESETPRSLLEAISQQYPAEANRVSPTHWRFNLPLQNHEPPSDFDNR